MNENLHTGSTMKCDTCGWTPDLSAEKSVVAASVKAHVDSGHREFTQASLPLGQGYDALRAEEYRVAAVSGHDSLMRQLDESWKLTDAEYVAGELRHADEMYRAYTLLCENVGGEPVPAAISSVEGWQLVRDSLQTALADVEALGVSA